MSDTAKEQVKRMAILLLECRDALPAISLVSARLHNVDLSLADRIEEELKPWLIEDNPPLTGKVTTRLTGGQRCRQKATIIH